MPHTPARVLVHRPAWCAGVDIVDLWSGASAAASGASHSNAASALPSPLSSPPDTDVLHAWRAHRSASAAAAHAAASWTHDEIEDVRAVCDRFGVWVHARGALPHLCAADRAWHAATALHAPVVLSCADSFVLQPMRALGLDSPLAVLVIRDASTADIGSSGGGAMVGGLSGMSVSVGISGSGSGSGLGGATGAASFLPPPPASLAALEARVIDVVCVWWCAFAVRPHVVRATAAEHAAALTCAAGSVGAAPVAEMPASGLNASGSAFVRALLDDESPAPGDATVVADGGHNERDQFAVQSLPLTPALPPAVTIEWTPPLTAAASDAFALVAYFRAALARHSRSFSVALGTSSLLLPHMLAFRVYAPQAPATANHASSSSAPLGGSFDSTSQATDTTTSARAPRRPHRALSLATALGVRDSSALQSALAARLAAWCAPLRLSCEVAPSTALAVTVGTAATASAAASAAVQTASSALDGTTSAAADLASASARSGGTGLDAIAENGAHAGGGALSSVAPAHEPTETTGARPRRIDSGVFRHAPLTHAPAHAHQAPHSQPPALSQSQPQTQKLPAAAATTTSDQHELTRAATWFVFRPLLWPATHDAWVRSPDDEADADQAPAQGHDEAPAAAAVATSIQNDGSWPSAPAAPAASATAASLPPYTAHASHFEHQRRRIDAFVDALAAHVRAAMRYASRGRSVREGQTEPRCYAIFWSMTSRQTNPFHLSRFSFSFLLIIVSFSVHSCAESARCARTWRARSSRRRANSNTCHSTRSSWCRRRLRCHCHVCPCLPHWPLPPRPLLPRQCRRRHRCSVWARFAAFPSCWR